MPADKTFPVGPAPRFLWPKGPVIQRNGTPVPTGLAYGVATGDGDLSLIHRVPPAQGTAVSTVRVYLTVFAYATDGGGYKDIHATPAGGIKLIHKTADTMFNIGDPRRAFHYYNTYRAQTTAAVCPIIRSFDIPQNLYDQTTGLAISESQRAKLGRANPYNVDKERGQNQFGVHQSARDEIERQGKNLISYVEANQMVALALKPGNGTIRDVNDLRRQLGMPTEVLDFMAPLTGAHVVPPRQEAAHGALLTRLYDDLDALVTALTGVLMVAGALKKIADRCVSTHPEYYGATIAPRVLSQNLSAKSLEDVKRFRDDIGRAATFSVIPQMVTEEYLQANARLHADDQLKAILKRLGDDLTELVDVRSDRMQEYRRVSTELAITNKCFSASSVTYGPYVGGFIRGKNLSRLSLSELTTLRDVARRAAAANGAYLSADEMYLRNVNAFALTIRDKNDQPLSRWAARQQYTIRTPAPVGVAPRKPKLTESDILRLKAEALERKRQKESGTTL